MNYISNDLANKYYMNILAIHRMNTEFYIKVTALENELEGMLALPELAGVNNETGGQKQWLNTNKHRRENNTGFIPPSIVSGLIKIYDDRNEAYHEKFMTKITYLGDFDIMARAISFFSNNTPIPQEIKNICEGNDAAQNQNDNRNQPPPRTHNGTINIPPPQAQNGTINQPPPPAQEVAPKYKIGDRGPAGGIVFYAKNGKYMECSEVLGTFNLQNAVTLVENYDGGDFQDWRLPTKDELNLIYVNLKLRNLGGFGDDFNIYWSSSEYDYTFEWFQEFRDGNQAYNFKDTTYSVRAVRAF